MSVACGSSIDPTSPPGSTVVPRGTRTLVMDVNPAEDGSYENAFVQAKAHGAQAVTLSFDWRSVERSPNHFDPTLLDIANAYYPAHGTAVELTLRPITTTYAPVPSDLVGRAFDDPVVVARFKNFVGYVLSRLTSVQLVAVYLGSESDIYLGADAAAWSRFKTLYEATVPIVHGARPGVPVGSELTYEGITGPQAALAAALNATSDVIPVSTYPLAAGYQVLAPNAIRARFDDVATRNPGRQISFNQLGYPSGAANGSSEEKQREFIAEAFAAWDAHADQIKIVTFTWQNDLSAAAVAQTQNDFGVHDPAFAAFIGSLGLRRYAGAGADKPAFAELGTQAHARGW